MSDYEPISPREALPTDPDSGNTSGSGSTVVEGLVGAASASSLPPTSSSSWPISATMAEQGSRPRMRRPPSKMRRGLVVAAALMGSATGLLVGIGTSSSAGAA